MSLMADIPNRVYDYSTLASWARCRRKWYYKEIEQIVPPKMPAALIFGIALHEGLDVRAVTENIDIAVLSGLKILATSDYEPDDKRNPGKLEVILRAYHKRYPLETEPFKYLRDISNEKSKEVEFHLPMPDGTTLAGRMDGLIEWGERLYVMEHKSRWTLGSHLVEQFNPNLQMDVYHYAAVKLLGRCDGVLIDVLQVAKTKEDFLRHISCRTADTMAQFEKTYMELVADLEYSRKMGWYTQDGFANGACVDFNTVCVYRDVCLYGMRVVELDGRFKKKGETIK